MKRLSFGLALSGGTAKSIAHIGVIKAIVEAGIKIDAIAGTSGGSIIAALYASGMPASTMEDLAKRMSWRQLMSLRISRLGFISSERIEDFMVELIGDLRFEELKIPCYVIATDLETGEKRAFRSGKVARAVRASCSIPQIYLPVEIDGKNYVDGGLSEYLPVETLEEAGNKFIAASQLAPVTSIYRRPHHILHLIMQLTGLMAKKNYVHSVKRADYVWHSNLDAFSSFDFDSAGKFIDVGYQTAKDGLLDMMKKWERKSSPLGRVLNAMRAKK